MRRVRVVLVLSVQHGKLVKTNRFRGPIYVGDPINTAKIFNDKMVDEVIVLDIGASRDGSAPDLELVTALAGECFMPLSYGGGIGSIEQISSLIRSGVEKVVLNTALLDKPELMSDAAKRFGSQSVVACIDVKKSLFGSYRARFRSGKKGPHFFLCSWPSRQNSSALAR